MAWQAETKEIPASARVFLNKIHPEIYSDVALLLLFAGAVMGLHFLYYEVSMLKRPHDRRLLGQILAALLASVFLGFAAFFLLAWAGVYV
eukprot:CAMPEP_0197908168 /NCGR_PEP_ID=MMETSP1439-20131203/66281_1 /TAXON_ID=66791 /ORGANISM="Gonyaulax spinifera, Strain CCMP409" /LENGTH=89 /DNA_ID=CAMNT_0043529639 /DNA_START=66 /DNA_END=335 /DNA_ORIENTATION=-